MIIGLLGNMGRGKTLSMTFMMYYLKNETHIDTVVTNYKTDITTDYVKNPPQLDEKTQELKERKENALYGLDEIWAWMDARESLDNDLMSVIILNSRKRGGIILYTTQSIDQADKRLRQNTDFIGVCNHYNAEESVHEYDHDVVKIDLYYKTEMAEYIKVNEMVINAETYYGTYDTREEIAKSSTADDYSDEMDMCKEKFLTGEWETKKRAVAFLKANKGLGTTQAETLVEEAVRMAEEESEDTLLVNQSTLGMV